MVRVPSSIKLWLHPKSVMLLSVFKIVHAFPRPVILSVDMNFPGKPGNPIVIS
jgi:hypothetical protein